MDFSFSEVLIYNVRLNFVLWTPRSKTFHIEIESICENASACLYHTNYVVKICQSRNAVSLKGQCHKKVSCEVLIQVQSVNLFYTFAILRKISHFRYENPNMPFQDLKTCLTAIESNQNKKKMLWMNLYILFELINMFYMKKCLDPYCTYINKYINIR